MGDPGGAGTADRRSGAVRGRQSTTGQRQRQPEHTRHVIARPFPRETPSPLSVLRPQQMWLLRWRLFHDLRHTVGLLDSPQQRHLRQQDQYAPRRTGAARPRRTAPPPHGPGAVRRILHGLHHRDEPAAHGSIGRHRRSRVRTEAGRARYPAPDGPLSFRSDLDRDGQRARIEARSPQG